MLRLHNGTYARAVPRSSVMVYLGNGRVYPNLNRMVVKAGSYARTALRDQHRYSNFPIMVLDVCVSRSR